MSRLWQVNTSHLDKLLSYIFFLNQFIFRLFIDYFAFLYFYRITIRFWLLVASTIHQVQQHDGLCIRVCAVNKASRVTTSRVETVHAVDAVYSAQLIIP